MQRGRAARWVAAAGCAVALLLTGAAPASAIAPRDPRCLHLVGGSTGLLLVGDQLPTADTTAGFGAVASEELRAKLPEDVLLKSATQGFGRDHAFAVLDGHVFVRRAREGRALPDEPWHHLKLPRCLDGRVAELSTDDRLLLVTDADGQVYSHDMPGGALDVDRWTWRWGPYFWIGTGVRIPRDVTHWAASEFTGGERFRDTAGVDRAPIGVATVYLLRRGGRRITYLDPWLAADDSREVCGPRRGTVQLAALSGSGSTVFAVSRRGELFTRLYDFDVSGANTVFGSFSWQRDRPVGDPKWQLPAPGWVRHRRPPGTITDRLAIGKTGNHADDRVLRVEGRTRRGRVGVWEKPLLGRTWRFIPTGGRLEGTPLSSRTKVRAVDPIALRYAGTIAGAPAEVVDFHPHCTPATLRVEVAPDVRVDLLLHTEDGLRQDTRAAGLDDVPREYNGAIEVPSAVRASGDRRVQDWLARALGGAREMTTAPVAVTRTRMVFIDRCWELTLDGRPARPDRPRIPPDLGSIAARVAERMQDDRPARPCR